MSDIDWDGPDVVLGYQPETAVCITTTGGIELLQRDGLGDTEYVYLTAAGALQVAWALIKAAHEVGLPKPPRKLMGDLDTGPSAPLAETPPKIGTTDGGALFSIVREAA